MIYAWFLHRVMFSFVTQTQEVFLLGAQLCEHVSPGFVEGALEAIVSRARDEGDAGKGFVLLFIAYGTSSEWQDIKDVFGYAIAGVC